MKRSVNFPLSAHSLHYSFFDLFRLANWEPDGKCAAFTKLALNGHSPAVLLNDGLDDRQA
jgi:hypothetical protein